MESLLAFAAALLAFRLTGLLLARWRARRAPELAAWAASLGVYALGAAALAWGAAAGWSDAAFRAYYLFGGLLTAALLGVGSLLFAGVRWALPAGLLYAGLAVGVALAVPLTQPVTGDALPHAADHLEVWPARVVAFLGNGVGTVAAVTVALLTIRRRPLGNALLLAGLATAAAGGAPHRGGVLLTAVLIAVAALLLYAGFVTPSRRD